MIRRRSHHVAGQDRLFDADSRQVLIQLGIGKRRRMHLFDELFAILRLQFCKLFGQIGLRGEHWCAVGDLVDHVNNLATTLTVLVEETRDCLARRWSIRHLELPLGVFVLGVDDHQSRVLCGCRGWSRADDLLEGPGCHVDVQ